MCTRFLSAALILFLSFSAFAKVTPANDFVKTELDNRISSLIDSGKVLKTDALWKSLSRLEVDIKTLRKDNPRQKETDEIYIETVMLVLKEIPRGQQFKKEKCSQYRIEILSSYDPHHETEPSPGVSKGLQVLDLFCQ
jgi:hypothetical protein